MTVDAKRKKNQKKKLKQKEKKALADKAAGGESIPDENELDEEASQAAPFVVDRVAAEEVVPSHVSREEDKDILSRDGVSRSGSPQLVAEPMGQAMECTPDLNYNELSPYQRYGDAFSKGEDSKDTNENDYENKENAIEETSRLSMAPIPSQKHHRSASASAAAASHLSEDTSENDVLLEGSIERRVSLQMKRQSMTGVNSNETGKLTQGQEPPQTSADGTSQGSLVHFNLPSNQDLESGDDLDSSIQSSFPFPSKRHAIEQPLSPNEVPQQQKNTNIEEPVPPIQNQDTKEKATDEVDQLISLDPVGSNRASGEGQKVKTQKDKDQGIGNSAGDEGQDQPVLRETSSDIPDSITQSAPSLLSQDMKSVTTSESFNEKDSSVQPKILTKGPTEITSNDHQIDDLFSGVDEDKAQDSMPWEKSDSTDTFSKNILTGSEVEETGVLKSSSSQQSVTNDQAQEKEQLPSNEQSSIGDSVQGVFEGNNTSGKPPLTSRKSVHDLSGSVAHSNKVSSLGTASSEGLAQSPSEVADYSSTVLKGKPEESGNGLDQLFGGSEEAGEREEMPWDTSYPTEPNSEPSVTIPEKKYGSELDENPEIRAESLEKARVSEEKEQEQVDAVFNKPNNERQELMPWEIANADHQDTRIDDAVKKDIEEERPERPIVRDPLDGADQVDALFGKSNEVQERMPWENIESDCSEIATLDNATQIIQKPSDNSGQVDTLFNESEHEPMPWEVSEQDQAPTEASTQDFSNQQETVEPKKFSFLENDDDLLDDDDDDSYLESEEEHENENENDQAVRTVATELSDGGQKLDGQPQPHTTTAAASSLNSPVVSHETISKYKPSNIPQAHHQNLQQNNFQTVVPPEATKGNVGGNTVHPQPQVSSGLGVQQRNLVEGQKVVEKINEEKKKSDAFDFPMDLVSRRAEKVHAKPVGVPSSHFGSPPPFEFGTQAPPRSSRNNSIASLPSNPYAAVANASKSKIQSPLPPQGVVLPQNTLPVGTQLSAPQAVPFPGSRKSSMRTQYGPTVRTRGYSNASTNGPMSAGTSSSLPPNFSVSPPQGPVGSLSKYAPNSPLKAAAHPSVSAVPGMMGANPVGVPPSNVGTLVNGPYAPPNVSKPLPGSSSFPQAVGGVPPLQPQNFPASNAPSVAPQNVPLPSYDSNVTNAGANGIPEAYPPAGPSANSAPPISGRGRNASNRVHAKSNSSVYAPNQNEYTSKYAPTVHPQYQYPSLPAGSTGVPNPLSSINAYMKSSHPGGVVKPRDVSIPKPIDNEALLQHQFPLFSWSSSEKFAYGISTENGQSAYLIGSDSSVKDFKLVNLDTILNSKNFLKSFPGPLVRNKSKGKDLQKWLEDHADELSKDNDLSLMILSLLKLKLTDNVNFKDISRVLYNSDELFLYLSQPVMQPKQVPSASKLDASNQMRISAYLQTGGQQEALQLSLEKRDFSMALLIGSLMGKEKWSEVVKKYLTSEVETATGAVGDSMFLTNLLSLIFQVFVGSSKTAFQEFYINEGKAKWALENWRMVVAAVLNNVTTGIKPSVRGFLEVPPVVVEFLVEYGVFLYRKEMKLPACILFMIANLPLSSSPVVADVDVKFEFIGSPYSLEGIIFSEIYEFCIADSKPFPVLMSQKLQHAACLHERGLTTAASKYTDYLGGILRNLPRKEDFSINLNNQLNNLNASIAGTSTGWLGKPKLSSVWGHLDKSFNKFIGGDDDSLIKKSSGKKVFDGFTPVSSRNNSTLDLSQTPFVPYRGHSKKPSYSQSETSSSTHPVGYSPIRNSAPIEEVSGGNAETESYNRYSSHINSNYQEAPKVSQYTPSRVATSGNAPPKLRRVHTMQPIGGMFPSSSGLSSESLSNAPISQQEIHTSSGKAQKASDSAFPENETSSAKKTQYYSSTPNLLRRSSAASDASSIRKGSSTAGRRLTDVPLTGELLKETSEESDLSPKILPKNPGDKITNEGNQLLSERPYLGTPSMFQGDESSPSSTVATESVTEEDEFNSDAERTVLRNAQVPWAAPPPKDDLLVTSSPDVAIEKGSGETLKKSKERPLRVSTNVSSVGTDSVDNRTPVVSTKNETGLGIKMKDSEFNSTNGDKTDQPPIIKSNPYAGSSSIRKSSSRKSYLPKDVTETSSPAIKDSTSEMDVNGLGMYVDESTVSKQVEERLVGNSPTPYETFSTPSLTQENQRSGGSNQISKFDPVKEPEEVSTETFEPVIKRTPKIKAFSPMVVQPSETQYDDVVEEESEDEDEEDLKRKKMEEEKAKEREEEEERREEESAQKAKKEKNKEKSSSGWFSWLKKDPNEKKPIKAKLGNKKRNFYYDEKLKRWVNNNASEEEKEKVSTPPPPPPVVKRMDNGPKTKPRSGSLTGPPKPAAGSVAPKNPITGEPLLSPTLSATTSYGSSDKSSAGPPSSNNSGVNLAGKKANGLDDLLNLAGGTASSTRRKKKPGRGYVNVMETK
ncbi:vesicle coat component [Zygosaccharomyces mellis]|uniref:Protein transport protein sec16 n=1 Tax=Zygosaccharomyces mellis TaxID=42258 RepID=A0A4C2ECL3_9SACH|nr:vesicle coat component [Zygosaccharomyces mellis]